MDFREYQIAANESRTYPDAGHNFVYPAMGIGGEGGECCDKAKKYWRNNNSLNPNSLLPEQREAIIKEMGDVLWYLAALSTELQIDFGSVASANLTKLRDRKKRGVLKSEGDNR